MVVFKNPFFSLAGQKERLKNVVDVLAISTGFKKGRIKAKAGILSKPLEVAAEHPFATAGIATVAVAPKLALSAIKEAVPKVAKTLLGTPKRALLTATGVGILQSSPLIRKQVGKVLTDPTGSGRKIGETIESTIGKEAKKGGTVAKVLQAGGLGAVGVAGAIVAGKAIKEKFAKTPTGSETEKAMPVLVGGEVGMLPTAIEAPTAVRVPKQTTPTRRRMRQPMFINQIQISN